MPVFEYPKVTLLDIVHEYWKGLRPWGGYFVGAIVLFVVTEVINVVIPIYYKKFFDVLGASTAGAGSDVLIYILLLILALNILWVLTRSLAYTTAIVADGHAIPRLRQLAFESLLTHSHSFFVDNYAGSMVSRVQRFASGYQRFGDVLYTNIIPLVINVGGAVIVIYYQQPMLALLVGVWAALFLVANYVFSRWRFRHNLALAALDSESTGLLADSVSNQSSVALFDGYGTEFARFRAVTEKHGALQRFLWNLGTGMDTVQLFFVVSIEFAVFYLALFYWEEGTITLGLFVLLQVLVLQISSKITIFGWVVRTVYEIRAQATEMVEIMKLPKTITDSPSAKELIVNEGAIEFREVSFNFNETRSVLSNFSLRVPPSQKVALVGPSGAGKTTIVRLVLRFYDVADGAVLLDDQDVRQVTQASLRRQLSFVPQDPALFHRSIMENIRYGRLDSTDEEVVRAAKLAHCNEFICDLPQGYDTLVGERGVKLSGGERQRIAIARAILKNAPILILDEATSSLDSESESLIQDALDELMKGKTVIVIAHRLSTIRKMDRIVVVQGGHIAEDGTHGQLLDTPGSLYKRLWELQAGGFIVGDNE